MMMDIIMTCAMANGSSLILSRGRKHSNLYVTQGSILGDSINLVESEALLELLHERLSHMSERGIAYLSKKNFLLV